MKNKVKLASSLASNVLINKPKPYILIFEPSQLCNCKCSFCYHWKEYDKNELNKEEILRVLKESYDLGCGYLLLNGGEPTIAKHFKFTLENAKKIGFEISITTNGYTLEKYAKYLSKYVNNITVSLDFPDERHDKYRGLKGLFKQLIKGIKEAKKYIPNIKLNYSIHKENLDCMEDMLKLAKELKIGIYFRMLIQEKKDEDELGSLVITNKNEIKEIGDKLIKLKKQGEPIISSHCYLKHLKELNTFKCKIGRFIINVDSHGRVYTNCPKYEGTKDYIFGSIRENSLKEIWNSKKAKDFMKATLKCKPNINCYTACIIEPSSLLKPNFNFWIEQFLEESHFKQFF